MDILENEQPTWPLVQHRQAEPSMPMHSSLQAAHRAHLGLQTYKEICSGTKRRESMHQTIDFRLLPLHLHLLRFCVLLLLHPHLWDHDLQECPGSRPLCRGDQDAVRSCGSVSIRICNLKYHMGRGGRVASFLVSHTRAVSTASSREGLHLYPLEGEVLINEKVAERQRERVPLR